MKNFLNTINWKIFAYEMFGIFAFLLLSYWAGNNKFPHKFWFVPILTVAVGLAVLGNAYATYNVNKEIRKRNGKNNG
jgi:apolipoprotein N-acyltransferase